MPSGCHRHWGFMRACDGCPLCCHKHPAHAASWAPYGCPECNKRGPDREPTHESEPAT